MHVHVSCPDGEKRSFTTKPIVSLCEFEGLSSRELRALQKIVEGRKNEIINSWKKHFKS